MAPIKALCAERYQDWKMKFEGFGLKCKELTGDTELDDYYELQEVNIILTTPVSNAIYGLKIVPSCRGYIGFTISVPAGSAVDITYVIQ